MRRAALPGWLVWGALALVVAVPLIAALFSPQLAWRGPVYIVAGFSGVVGLALLLMQPLLAGGYLPGLSVARARLLHRISGAALVLCVVLHVAGLWITSPPDVIDALLFVSPTPFAAWGVVAMWAIFASALIVVLRRRLAVPVHIWRRAHSVLAVIVVVGSVVHAALILGTMEPWSKYLLCALVVIATGKVIYDRRAWVRRIR